MPGSFIILSEEADILNILSNGYLNYFTAVLKTRESSLLFEISSIHKRLSFINEFKR